MSWHNKKFIDFILLQRGYDLTKEQIIPGIYPVVTSTSIMGYHNTYKVNGPGVVTGRSGTIGEVQYITKNYWPHNTTLYVKDFKGNHPKFVYYFMKNFGTIRAKSGSAVPTLNRNNLSDMNVKVPDYEIQVCITDILSSYDSLIENNQKQIKLLEEAAQRLYKEWFVDLHFPGYEDVKIVDGVPEGWTEGTLGDVSTFKRGKTITKDQVHDGDVPVVAGGLEPAYYNNKSNTVAPVITVSGSGANAGFARLYNVDVFASDCSFVDSETTPFLFFAYCFIKYNKPRLDALQKGAAQPHVYAKDINALKLSIPTKELLSIFCNKVALFFGKIKGLQKQITLLTQARDRLLPKLMSGEIEV